MYINDVIKNVKRLYPSEYSDEEMYIWCDEVSSMLTIEDRNVFKETVLRADKNGTFLLPEDVNIENVESVFANGRCLEKSDFRNIFIHENRGYLKDTNILRVVYLQPYYPIRLAKYRGEVSVSNDGSCFEISFNEFASGDIISICINEYEFSDIPLFETEYATPSKCVLKTTETDIPDGEYTDCVITRLVTDKTVCSAPYDSMYIDYILAKINMFQRDMQSYNHHMTAFNSRLSAYKKWIINHMPPEDGKLKNWW